MNIKSYPEWSHFNHYCFNALSSYHHLAHRNENSVSHNLTPLSSKAYEKYCTIIAILCEMNLKRARERKTHFRKKIKTSKKYTRFSRVPSMCLEHNVDSHLLYRHGIDKVFNCTFTVCNTIKRHMTSSSRQSERVLETFNEIVWKKVLWATLIIKNMSLRLPSSMAAAAVVA